MASKWHTDVALFLLDHGADPNRTDFLGRCPLHVAAADDYPDMCKLLIEKGGIYICHYGFEFGLIIIRFNMSECATAS